jgi:hypothetical protein
MKLRDKEAEARFLITAHAKTWMVDPYDELSERQAVKMSTRPHMIIHYAHHLAEQKKMEGYAHVEVRAHVKASLNGRRYQTLVDPRVDLAAQPRALFKRASWIEPLRIPLRERAEPKSHGGFTPEDFEF